MNHHVTWNWIRRSRSVLAWQRCLTNVLGAVPIAGFLGRAGLVVWVGGDKHRYRYLQPGSGAIDTSASSIGRSAHSFMGRRLPLAWVLTIPFVSLSCAAVVIVGGLSLRNSQQAVNDLSDRLHLQVRERVSAGLVEYFNRPKQSAQLFALSLIHISEPTRPY